MTPESKQELDAYKRTIQAMPEAEQWRAVVKRELLLLQHMWYYSNVEDDLPLFRIIDRLQCAYAESPGSILINEFKVELRKNERRKQSAIRRARKRAERAAAKEAERYKQCLARGVAFSIDT